MYPTVNTKQKHEVEHNGNIIYKRDYFRVQIFENFPYNTILIVLFNETYFLLVCLGKNMLVL